MAKICSNFDSRYCRVGIKVFGALILRGKGCFYTEYDCLTNLLLIDWILAQNV